MSENVTHTAVCDDALRIVAVSDSVCSEFKDATRSHRDLARLGSVTRGGDTHNPVLLETLRNRWPTRKPEDHLEHKLAFVIGWLSHRAADRQMKPLFRALHPTKEQRPTECSVYNDAYIYNEIYAHSDDNPYGPAAFDRKLPAIHGTDRIDTDAVRSLFQALLSQSMVELHTLSPSDNGEEWLERLIELRTRFYVDLDRYAEAVANPDPVKVARFITEPNFYDREEPLIAAARRVQRGETAASDDARRALAAVPLSHYGIALRTALGYIEAASEFFTTDMSVESLKISLDIGKPGRDGQAV